MLLVKDYLTKPVEEEIANFVLEASHSVKFSR